MSANLPPIFIESSGHCGGMIEYTLGDTKAVEYIEGRYVRLADYLALKDERDRLAREVKLLFSDT